jgi:septal ring factor EnvC (AmiA/AmiB activator)
MSDDKKSRLIAHQTSTGTKSILKDFTERSLDDILRMRTEMRDSFDKQRTDLNLMRESITDQRRSMEEHERKFQREMEDRERRFEERVKDRERLFEEKWGRFDERDKIHDKKLETLGQENEELKDRIVGLEKQIAVAEAKGKKAGLASGAASGGGLGTVGIIIQLLTG